MTTFSEQLTPCGRSRREFLWETGGGFTGLALLSLLSADGFFSRHPVSAANTVTGTSPMSPRKSHFPGTAKSVICIFNYGGPSQMDLFDPKPELNKRHGQVMPNMDRDPLFKVRGNDKLMGSPRKFSPAGKSGIPVSDFFPHLATCIDDIAVVRSMYADSFAHGSGLLQMNTGFLRLGFPSVGSWVTYGLGSENQNLPGFVVMLDHRGGPIGGAPNWGCGFMPAAFQGTQFRNGVSPIIDLQPIRGMTRERQRDQLNLLSELNNRHLTTRPGEDELQARIASYELAFRMQQHAPEAVDLSQESQSTHALYGTQDPATERFGRQCLMARRLVERGVRFVQVYSGGGHLDENWDAHSNVEENHKLHCKETDRPIAGLLQDLKARGLLSDTLVIWTGEFGRTPTAQNGTGRDHNPRGFTSWLAGGGVKGGQIIGATDEFGFAAVENKVHVHDFHATILHLLGMDHELLTYYYGGRDMRLTDVAGRIVKEVLK